MLKHFRFVLVPLFDALNVTLDIHATSVTSLLWRYLPYSAIRADAKTCIHRIVRVRGEWSTLHTCENKDVPACDWTFNDNIGGGQLFGGISPAREKSYFTHHQAIYRDSDVPYTQYMSNFPLGNKQCTRSPHPAPLEGGASL